MNNPRPIAVIETDVFCDGCGFNLHTQHVWRDERLGIMLCRCPECGRHHAAADRTSAGTAWLRRLALVGLIAFLCASAIYVIGVFFLLLGIQLGGRELLVRSNFETLAGEFVHTSYAFTSPTRPGPYWVRSFHGAQTAESEAALVVPNDQVVYRLRSNLRWLIPPPGVPFGEFYASPNRLAPMGLILLAVVLVFLAGCILSAGTWFWRARWRWTLLTLPVLAAAVTAILEWSNATTLAYYHSGSETIPQIGTSIAYSTLAVVTLLQVSALALGIAFGRRVVRLLLLVFIPPRARQLFAFLWHCDNLTMPTSRSPGERAVLTSPAAPS